MAKIDWATAGFFIRMASRDWLGKSTRGLRRSLHGNHTSDTPGGCLVYAALVGGVTLVVGLTLPRVNRRMPFLLISLLVGYSLAVFLTQVLGVERTHMAFVGPLSAALPPLSAPDLSIDTLKELAPAVLTTTLFALADAVSIGRSLALRSGHSLEGNREFIGQGLSSLIGSFFSSYVATGSFNRSGINKEALANFVPELNPGVCRTCKLRIFRECRKQPAPGRQSSPENESGTDGD